MAELVNFRNIKSSQHFSIDLTNVKDKRLSWRAKGIFTYLSSRPKDWSIRTADLLNKSTDGITSLNTGIKELINTGYVHRAVQKEEGKICSWVYFVFEKPVSIEYFKEFIKGDNLEARE